MPKASIEAQWVMIVVQTITMPKPQRKPAARIKGNRIRRRADAAGLLGIVNEAMVEMATTITSSWLTRLASTAACPSTRAPTTPMT